MLNVDAVNGDVVEYDVGVGNIPDTASRIVHSLNTHAILGVEDDTVGYGDIDNVIQSAAADRADGETMATIADAVGENNVLSLVSSSLSCISS